jgi:hypothetical protein
VEGQYRRESLKTRSWERATELALAIEDGKKTEGSRALTIGDAIVSFNEDAKNGRKMRPATLKKYRVLQDQLTAYAEQIGVVKLKEIDVNFARAFRNSWKDGAISALKSWNGSAPGAVFLSSRETCL